MFAALGSEPHLRIMRLLRLRNEDLVNVQHEGTSLRYSANTVVPERLLGLLDAE